MKRGPLVGDGITIGTPGEDRYVAIYRTEATSEHWQVWDFERGRCVGELHHEDDAELIIGLLNGALS